MKIEAGMDLFELAYEVRSDDIIALEFIRGGLRRFTGMDTRDLDREQWHWIIDEAHDRARDKRASEWIASGNND